jgi:hypothetical protein
MTLRERVSDRYGTYDGIDPAALATVRALPDHFRDWLQRQEPPRQQ